MCHSSHVDMLHLETWRYFSRNNGSSPGVVDFSVISGKSGPRMSKMSTTNQSQSLRYGHGAKLCLCQLTNIS